MAYFDTNTSKDFTIRVHYDNSTPGYITITNVQLQSLTYGSKWFPKGSITINGETVLTMDYTAPATHVFNVTAAGDTWYDIAVANTGGVALPVSNSTEITASTTTIAITVQLYRSSDGNSANLSGSETVELLSGLVYIGNGSSFDAYQAYIDNGSSWDRYIPYIDNGSSWDPCG